MSSKHLRRYNARRTEDNSGAVATCEDSGVAAKRLCWKFEPVDYRWQKQQITRFGVDIIKKHVPRKNVNKLFHQHTVPTTCVNVRGDGNCFYRVLSIAVAGAEQHHAAIREQVVAYMYTERINLQIAQLYAELDVEAVGQQGNWATDAEIFAAASYLKTNIFVHTSVGWQIYESGRLSDEALYLCKVYIKHSSDHFYFVKNV
ncbi:MAG: hypothetical protein K0U41_08060 [Gammaproteobacteria bacterium]|nr:hypothetical protein [Gammaproteobacteria bacterium]